MGKSTNSRIMFNRKRFNIRQIINVKNGIIAGVFISIGISVFTLVSGMLLKQKVKNSTVIYKADNIEQVAQEMENNTQGQTQSTENNDITVAVNSTVDETQKSEESNALVQVEETENPTTTTNPVNNTNNRTPQVINNSISLTLLGEIMMGGEVTTNLDYIYTYAFKEIYTKTRLSDFTYANLTTNITNLDKLNEIKSKYIVTKEIVNGLNSLGIDSVSIASDHMLDFSSDMFNITTGILEDNEIFVAGRKNMPVYFEKGNKKIAIISTNSVYIGTSKLYSKNDISIYEKDNLIKNIKEAKQNADFVIVDFHWGRDNIYGVTDDMRDKAMIAVDNGADLVVGTHALGVYPVVYYNSKPIIYSLGALISDIDYTVGKESFIFDININESGKLDRITMTPTIVPDKKQVRLYSEYDKVKSDEILQMYNTWHLENSLDSKIEDNKIVINFK